MSSGLTSTAGRLGGAIFGEQVFHPDIAFGQAALDPETAFLFAPKRKQQAQMRRQGLFEIRNNQFLDLRFGLRGFDGFVKIGHNEHDLNACIVWPDMQFQAAYRADW